MVHGTLEETCPPVIGSWELPRSEPQRKSRECLLCLHAGAGVRAVGGLGRGQKAGVSGDFSLWSKSRHYIFSVKDPIVNIFGFAVNLVCVSILNSTVTVPR